MTTASGWAAPTLMKAYDIVEDVSRRTHHETDAWRLLQAALQAIEDADIAIEEDR